LFREHCSAFPFRRSLEGGRERKRGEKGETRKKKKGKMMDSFVRAPWVAHKGFGGKRGEKRRKSLKKRGERSFPEN